jgi:hypothetical protein
VLALLPPSESTAPPAAGGTPVDLGALSFPSLAGTRARVLEALIATSARDDRFDRLLVGASLALDVAAA